MKLSFPRGLSGGVTILVLLCCGNSAASVLINEIMYHPASEDIREEYIELLNTGATNVTLAGWRFSKGVQFTFPNVTLAAGGYLVVAADVTVFANKYPGVANVIGNWNGRLSNNRNGIDLEDATSNRVDSVGYADEGDWAVRRRTPPDHSHLGWTWFAEADGFGKSLELINANLPNDQGQNWAPSLVTNGTPGAPNGVLQTNIAPLILNVQHLPPIPRSVDSVLVTAQLLDERNPNLTATLFWRLDGPDSPFTSQPMYDDGLHSDGIAGDGVFGATIPPQINNAIVEFYVQATDQDNHTRTWPAAAIDTNGVSLGQAANMLYQVDDSTYTGTFPLYKLIMKETNRVELAQIGSGAQPGETDSDAEMNGTFISVDGTGTDVRYITGIRNRGHGTRNKKPNNYRVGFNTDRQWKGVSALNINGQYTHSQLLGAVLALKSGL
ncbi:MAG TPA: lamin tail domain-containing protein, partial [Verrucomicrobiae bacterium]|nr:lamin tail domain-containing protein [Verrucomicrobiae bacterium]